LWGVSFAVAAIIGIWVFNSDRDIEVTYICVTDESLGRALGSTTIVQISDIHISSASHLTKLTTILKDLRPDILVLTGDYVKWNGDYGGALEFLSSIRAKKGVYAVMGDYDYGSSRKSCLFCHAAGSGGPSKRHGVRFLRDECVRYEVGGHELLICGLEAEQDVGANPSEKVRTIQNALKGVPAIVLSHSPLAFDHFRNDDDVLILAGDTHGGQVPLPKRAWRALGYEKSAKYEQGWFQEGKKKMYVNRGIGTSHVPIRLFRKPEVTVFHFRPGPKGR
jgi:predicted MPP superfamily phosphohydrolase